MVQQMDRFLQIDRQVAGGRAQVVWPTYLKRVYPFMEGWNLQSMLLALLRALHHRQAGRAWLQYVEVLAMESSGGSIGIR